jgi:DNA (cytosine-5)-methyltransferase 1
VKLSDKSENGVERPLTFGSLFAGIGGIDLGLEWAGMRCRWQVEIDPYCRAVLQKHWPNIIKWEDIRTFPPQCGNDELDSWWRVDVLAGGFPCQDISEANAHGEGLDGERSALWFEFARIVGVLRPRYVLVENVAALAYRGLGRVLVCLSEIGFDAEWSVVSACSMGAPHTRERLFIVAYPSAAERRPIFTQGRDLAGGQLLHGGRKEAASWRGIPHAICDRPWTARPELYGVAHGVPHRVDRINGAGNAVIPDIAELIGRRIVAHVSTQNGLSRKPS